ncbi:hypothetical protein [Amycolatopsis sp. GA6-003]|uniref:hypothetical protein n=1 Tax=Amycolatopsis sp. GA6-003 TaxID=2652444 RepID=UPI003916EA84
MTAHDRRRDGVVAGGRSPFGVVWGQVYGMEHRLASHRAEVFLPQARALGARLTRLFLYWGQLEPAPGQYRWDALDAYARQLEPGDEAWVMLASSSPWATRTPSSIIPSSPATDPDSYYRFVRTAVERCRGRVRYWQMEFEMSGPFFWAGTAAEYVAQLAVFRRAVKDADPAARIVLAGFLDGDYEASALEQERAAFSDHLLRAGADLFDLLDLHLYHDAETIPATIQRFRNAMRTHGCERPIFVGECNGPGFTQFPENAEVMPDVLRAMHSLAASVQAADPAEQARYTEDEHATMRALYARMAELPPQTQMFMEGCSAELERKRHRVNCRELVIRAVLALASGVERVCCFALAPDVAGKPDHVLNLLFGKYNLMGYADGALTERYPSADAFQRLAARLDGVREVRRRDLPGHPEARVFDVDRAPGPPLTIAWERRDAFTGEDAPPTRISWPWPYGAAHAVDVFGATVPASVSDATLRLPLSNTPVYVQPSPARS